MAGTINKNILYRYTHIVNIKKIKYRNYNNYRKKQKNSYRTLVLSVDKFNDFSIRLKIPLQMGNKAYVRWSSGSSLDS